MKFDMYSSYEFRPKLEKAELLKIFKAKKYQEMKYNDLLSIFREKFKEDVSFRKKIIKKYPEAMAMHPNELQDTKKITVTERRRWIEEEKLPVIYWEGISFHSQNVNVPWLDRYFVEFKLSDEKIERWREEHKKEVSAHRKAARKKAEITKKVNQKIVQQFQVNRSEMFDDWFSVSEMCGKTFSLAYWTMWLSRWAKRHQEIGSRRNREEHEKKKNELYRMKDEAFYILNRSPLTNLAFYRPEEPHKYHFYLCDFHYDMFRDERRYGLCWSAWDYFWMNKKMIQKCPDCQTSCEADYYSLYFLEVKAPDVDEVYSFHLPYPIGRKELPNPKELPKVHHIEEEGMFRFGRSIEQEEILTHKEKEVIENFKVSLMALKELLSIEEN